MLLAIAVSAPPYFVTNAYLPDWLSSELDWFAFGLVPPLTLSSALLIWRRAVRLRRTVKSGLDAPAGR